MQLKPSHGLVLGLLPAAVAFAEVFRGTRTSPAWHPLGVVAFAWMAMAITWWCWREYRKESFPQDGQSNVSLFAIGLFILGSLALHPLLVGLLTGGWGIPYKLDLDPDLLYYGLSVLLWLAAFIFLQRLPGERIDFNLRLNRNPADFAIFAIFGLITWAVLRLYLQSMGGAHPPMEIFGVTKLTSPSLYYTVGAIFIVVNALTEELWFRGVLLGALRNLLPMWPAILLQALCFGLAHWMGTPQGVFGLLLAGVWAIALGWWTWHRRSLWQAFTVHLLADWLIFAYTNG